MVCWCTLAGTMACKTCPKYLQSFGQQYKYTQWNSPKRIIEKYDDKGNLIERITEE